MPDEIPSFPEPPAIDVNCYSETLEDVLFPFDEADANRRVDLGNVDEPVITTPDGIIELGVFGRQKRANRRHLKTRLLSKKLPAKSLITASRKMSFASPELIIAQLAVKYSPVQLAQIIMEFTGTYSLSPDASDSRYETRFGAPQVTTVSRINAMMQHMPRVVARHKLVDALEMAIEGSASPTETIIALMLSLPAENGGYEMGAPVLNPRIAAPENLREHLLQREYYPDIFFQDCYADVEYESTAFHLDPVTANWQHHELALWRDVTADKAADDRRRMRELQMLGVQVIPATHKDIASADSMDRLAWALALCRECSGGRKASSHMEMLANYRNRMARESLLETLKAGSMASSNRR